MAELVFESVRKSFGAVEVIKGVDLRIPDCEFTVFVGPSGCGKSTMLRMLAGLEQVTAGRIEIDGTVVNDMAPVDRGIAMVFQSYALYPHMSVFQNMAFALKQSRTPASEIETRVREAARSLQIEELLARRPKELSGGQRQRVAIGRAIVRQPKVFLFDEPLSNLDAALRSQMRVELRALHRRLATNMIYVTHDQIEAMTLADRIVVFDAGRIEQVGTPRELYERPRNTFVAQFIGSPKMNMLDCNVEAAGPREVRCTFHDGQVIAILVPDGKPVPPGRASLGVRPEHLVLNPGDGSGFAGTVTHVEYLGDELLAHVDLVLGVSVTVKRAADVDIHPGAPVRVGPVRAHCHLFDASGVNHPVTFGASPS
jgi:multiple sugar transport system ATP-binding protein